jgi:group I intron endonuclease
MRTGIIYLLTSVSGKRYVGQTVRTLEDRWAVHKSEAKSGSNTALHRAIRKHGAASFTVESLFTCDEDDLSAMEIGAIKHYNTRRPNGYNITIGGDGVGSGVDHPNFGRKLTPETCAKMSAAFKGRKMSPEARANMSAAQKRRKPTSEQLARLAKLSAANKGKKQTPEARAKISAAQKGRTATEETRVKIAAAKMGSKNPNFGKKRQGASSRYFGVSWEPRKNRWRARPRVNGKNKDLGTFHTEVAAAMAVDNYTMHNGIDYPRNFLQQQQESAA